MPVGMALTSLPYPLPPLWSHLQLHKLLSKDLYGHIRHPIVHADLVAPKSADQRHSFYFDT